jgi:hypothetical protein
LWWPSDPDDNRVKVAEDFGDFFFKMVSEAIEGWCNEKEPDE